MPHSIHNLALAPIEATIAVTLVTLHYRKTRSNAVARQAARGEHRVYIQVLTISVIHFGIT